MPRPSCEFACRSRYRVSYLCRLNFWTAASQLQPHIAEVQHFVRARLSDGPTKRLAACRLMRASLSEQGVLRVTAGQTSSTEMAMVEVDSLDCKLATANQGGVLFRAPYANTSGM